MPFNKKHTIRSISGNMSLLFLIIIFFIGYKSLEAQLLPLIYDSTYKFNYLYTNLNDNINSSNLKTSLNVILPHKKFQFTIKSEFISEITKLDKNFARDLMNTNVNTDYVFGKRFSVGTGFQRKTLSDDKNIEVNKLNDSYYYLNFNYFPVKEIKINVKIGIKDDEQIGESASGLSGILLTEIDRLILSDFKSSGTVNLMNENLIKKKNHIYEISTSVLKEFSTNAENLLNVRFHNYKNDFFIPATQGVIGQYDVTLNTQTRAENLIFIQNNLKYFFLKNFRIHLSGSIISRGYLNEYKYKPEGSSAIFENIYDTKVNENRIEASAKVEFYYKNLIMDLRLVFSERSEIHELINSSLLLPQQVRELEKIEKNKNNSGRISSVIINTAYQISNTNSLKLSSSSTLLKYDTDTEENSDDRDELYINASISHLFSNLRNFNLQTSFEINFTTLSYIFKEKSANNNTNKIYRLTSRSEYSPIRNLKTVNSFQVLANYTVYKFEDLLSQVQSYIFRQLYIWDTTRFDITKNFFFNLDGEVKLYEQGQYNDENFSIKPANYYVENKINFNLNYNYGVFTVGFGFRYFLQDQYIYIEGEKNLRRSYESRGPYANLSLLFNDGSLVFINAGQDLFKASDNPIKNKSNYLNLRVLWKI